MLVHIDEVELVKQQIFSLALTLGRICTTLMAAIMLVCGLTGPLSAVLGPATTVAGAVSSLFGPPAAAVRMFQWA
jgi:hypothetical protein